MSELTEAFLRGLPPGAASRLTTGPELAASLDALVAAARAAWPTLELEPGPFVEHVAGRVGEKTELSTLQAADLYLAFGCALGDPQALDAFEQQVLIKVTGALKGQLPNGATADDVAQRLRLKLF